MTHSDHIYRQSVIKVTSFQIYQITQQRSRNDREKCDKLNAECRTLDTIVPRALWVRWYRARCRMFRFSLALERHQTIRNSRQDQNYNRYFGLKETSAQWRFAILLH